MFEFAIYALMMILIAIGFVVFPIVLSNNSIANEETDDVNINLAKAKLRELKAEMAAGQIAVADYEASRKDLELGLYHELEKVAAKRPLVNGGRWLALGLGFLIPLIALFLYSSLGDLRSLQPTDTSSAKAQPQVNEMVDRLAKRLAEQPKDLQGWLMLGRSYKAMQRYDEAIAALRSALALKPDDTDIMLQLADTLAMANNGSLKGEAGSLIEQAIRLKPDSEMGLWLSGLSKAEMGDFQTAIQQWKTLQSHFSAGDSDYQEVQDLIDKAQSAMGERPSEQPKMQSPKASNSIRVMVKLDEHFKASVSPDDWLLVYAKASNGPKMPLAALKRKVSDLPLDVTLDDSMSMMPGLSISSFDRLTITARISQTGNATPQSGELIGTVDLDKTKHLEASVSINDKIP